MWDTPAGSRPEALLALDCRDDGTIAYLSAVRPIYDALKRCLGQLSGVLLLFQASGLDRDRSGLLMASVRQQLDEVGERIGALAVPAAAARHCRTLQNLIQSLEAIGERLDRAIDLIDPGGADLNAVVEALFSVQRGLLAAAEPRAGLAPVDFAAACCTCRPRTKMQAA